jgi:hypothetical protein
MAASRRERTVTVYCIECGESIEAAARICDTCGAAQPVDDVPFVEPVPGAVAVAVAEAEPVAVAEPEPVAVAEPEPVAVAEPEPVAVAESEPEPEPVTTPIGTACAVCGRPLAPEARFCGGCGASRPAAEPAPPPPPAAAAPPRPAPQWQNSLPAQLRPAPPEVLGVCGLMGLAGVLTLWPALKVLPDVFDLLGAGGLARSFGLFLLSISLLLAFFGGACLFLAWRLRQADRVARGLTYVLLGGLTGSILFGNTHTTGLTIVMLTAAAAAAVLALAPGSREFFASGRQGEHPDGLVIARTIVSVWAAIMLVVGLTFLPLGSLGGKFVAVGAFLIAIGAAAFYLNARLAEGDETARIAVSAGAGVYFVLLLVLGDRSPGLLLPLAMVVGVAGYLWIPADVQEFFSRRPMR